MITYGSVCSGIESASVAWEPLGYRPLWFSEIEPFPSAVLAHHWPTVPNVGDMLALPFLIERQVFPAPDVLVGGTPCQAFSVAGMRAGLDDARGQLTIKYVEVLNAIDEQREEGDECVAVWENVPGVLSSKDNAFGCFLAALVGEEEPIRPAGAKWTHAGSVYGPQRAAAWRVLDAQYFGVAQRRRRVFVVASARNGFDPAEILFEFDGVRRDTPPSREAGEGVAGEAGGCAPFDMQAFGEYGRGLTASTLKMRDYKDAMDLVVHGTQDPCVSDKAFALGRNNGQENVICETQFGVEVAGTLTARYDSLPCSDRGANMVAYGVNGDETPKVMKEQSPTLRAEQGGEGRWCMTPDAQVRRLTPVECERLQGFPDGHTLIPWRGKPASECPDGPRYKAIGNSKAVPVVRWLGLRIKNYLEVGR